MRALTKKGRPVGSYRASWGDRIEGLTKLADGRWKISPGPNRPKPIKFSEVDERQAVAHFYAITEGGTVHVPVAAVPASKLADALAKEKGTKRRLVVIPKQSTKEGDFTATFEVKREQPEAEFWAHVRDQLINHREYAAKMTGIAWLAWGPDLKPPTTSPTLKEVGAFYCDRNDLSEKEAQKCRATWTEFRRAMGVDTVREITPEAMGAWGLKVKAKKLAAKTVHHQFNRVKTILNHFKQTGRCLDDIRHALDCAAVLKAPETTSLDPHPIARADFHKLLDAAEGEGKAMLLVGLNLCMYPIDVARLRWSDMDIPRGVYHAQRGKTKVARCGVLWSRTITELEKIARGSDDGYVFHKDNGQPHTDTTIRKWFWDLRETAGVAKAVQFADIRDGAFTEAVAGEGVEFQHAQVLAGHRSGIADAYVRRAPRMVEKACEAIRLAYSIQSTAV